MRLFSLSVTGTAPKWVQLAVLITVAPAFVFALFIGGLFALVLVAIAADIPLTALGLIDPDAVIMTWRGERIL